MNFSRKPRNARCACCRSQKPREDALAKGAEAPAGAEQAESKKTPGLCDACNEAGCRQLIGDLWKRAPGCPLKARTSAAARKSWSNRRAP